jgi:Molybdopterin oxidoreductase
VSEQLAFEQGFLQCGTVDRHDRPLTTCAVHVDKLPAPAIRPYPVRYVSPWRLKDSTVTFRPIRPDDEPLMAIGRAKTMMIFWGMGISQHVHGTDNARCLISLCLLTGNIGRPGTGLHPLRGQNNVQGASLVVAEYEL